MADRLRTGLVEIIDRALGDDPKQALIASRELQAEVGWLAERAVAVARREGYDWGRIGRLLGITRQSARARFKAAPPRLPPHLVARNRALKEQQETERLLGQMRSKARLRYDDDDAVAW